MTNVILHAAFNGFGTAHNDTRGAPTRPDALVSGDLFVAIGVNVGVLILLLPCSWRRIRHLQRERSALQT